MLGYCCFLSTLFFLLVVLADHIITAPNATVLILAVIYESHLAPTFLTIPSIRNVAIFHQIACLLAHFHRFPDVIKFGTCPICPAQIILKSTSEICAVILKHYSSVVAVVALTLHLTTTFSLLKLRNIRNSATDPFRRHYPGTAPAMPQ